MKRLLSLSLLAVFVALAGCRTAPIEDVDAAPLFAPDTVTLERVKKGIIRAGLFRDWDMTEVEPGHILAQVNVRGKHSATVDIFFDTKVFSIKYKDSRNLHYDGDTIHSNYNQWIRNLKKDIQKEMKLIGVSWSPTPPKGIGSSSELAQQPN